MRRIREFTDQVDELTELAVTAAVERDYDLAIEVKELYAEIGDREHDILHDLPEMSNESLLEVREVLSSVSSRPLDSPSGTPRSRRTSRSTNSPTTRLSSEWPARPISIPARDRAGHPLTNELSGRSGNHRVWLRRRSPTSASVSDSSSRWSPSARPSRRPYSATITPSPTPPAKRREPLQINAAIAFGLALVAAGLAVTAIHVYDN